MTPFLKGPAKAINWVEISRQHLHSDFPEFRARVDEITFALCRLLMERLPLSITGNLVMLLPEDSRRALNGMRVRAGGRGNPEITYAHFVHKVFEILNRADFPTRNRELQALATRITDSFLWSIAHEIPPEMKHRMADFLPIELRSRMNLFSGYGEEDKVA